MIRALRPEDAPVVAAIQRESEVPEAVPAEGIVHWFGAQPERARVVGWVAVEGAAVVGWARARLLWKTSAPGVGEVWAFVAPRARGRGHGGGLVEAALAHLREADARVLESWAVVDDGRRFLEARGFRPGRSQRVLVLDLAGVEVPEPGPLAGVRVVPLREVLDRPRELHALDAAAVADVPETFVYDDVRYDEWRRTELENPALELDGSFVALAGELPVAYAFVYADRAAGVAANDMTGTLPAYRRRGLARLVKLATIRWARAEGFGRFVTESDDENVGMLRLNESLGYRQVAVETEYLREVPGEPPGAAV